MINSKPVLLNTLVSLNIPTPLNKFAKASIELRELRKTVCGHLKFHKIVYGEFEILYLLKGKQLIQPSCIVAELVHEAATVSRLLGRLHDDDYISYNYDDDDRRRVHVQITDDGEKFIHSILESFVYGHSDSPTHLVS
jgi:DNA-binding MarR family transcriptional regulator